MLTIVYFVALSIMVALLIHTPMMKNNKENFVMRVKLMEDLGITIFSAVNMSINVKVSLIMVFAWLFPNLIIAAIWSAVYESISL